MKKYLFLVVSLVCLFCCSINTKALVVFDEDNSICTETKEHKIWKSMPKEEKSKVIEPVKCKENVMAGINGHINHTAGTIGDVNPNSATSFNLKDYGYLSEVRNQEMTNLCWTFAATDAIETNYKIKTNKTIALSQKHMAFNTAALLSDNTVNPFGYYGKAIDSGGSVLMIGAYLAQHRGPVLASSVPWSTTVSTLENAVNLKNDYTVNDINVFASTSCQANNNNAIKNIKEILTTTGPVIGLGNISMSNFADDGQSYYYNGSGLSCHAFMIVGWDDNYAASNFRTTPAGNGAFIVKDQQGSDFADDGYYYISYYDSNVCQVFSQVDNVIKTYYDNEYSLEPYGVSSNFITADNGSVDTLYLKNVFTKKTNGIELLNAITIGTYQAGDTYNVYYSADGTLNNATLIDEGTANSFGYDTIRLDNPITISDDQYSIIVEYTSADNTTNAFPVSLLSTTNNAVNYMSNPQSGISYYSVTGTNWVDSISSSAELKFYPTIYTSTNSTNFEINLEDPTTENDSVNIIDGGSYDFAYTLDEIDSLNDIDISIFNLDTLQDATDDFTITSTASSINVAVKPGITAFGDYQLTLTYRDAMVGATFYVSQTTGVDVRSISIDGENEVAIGGTLDLVASIYPSDASNKIVEWNVNNDNATINNGVVKGLKAGTVVVTATSTDGTNVRETKTITVVDPATVSSNSNNSEIVSNPKTGIRLTLLILFLFTISFGAVYYSKKKAYFNK